MPFDIRTLMYCNTILAGFISAALFFYKTTQKTYTGFGCWVTSGFFVTLGYGCLLLRGTISEWVSILLVNGAFVMAAILRLDGIKQFTRKHHLRKLFYGAIPLIMAVCAWFYFITDNMILRNLLTSILISVFGVMTSVEIFRNSKPANRNLYWAAGIIYTSYVLLILLRAFIWFINPYGGLWDAGPFHRGYFLMITLYEVGVGICFLMMNHQRLELELRESRDTLHDTVVQLKNAMAHVETLSGLLPICATCKKIRDDQGYWNQIEAYLRKHTNAEFSHGICPECAQKYYPEFNLYDETGNPK